MTEIPEDVRKEADEALYQALTSSPRTEVQVEVIARALMTAKAEATAAERERAAKVAENYPRPRFAGDVITQGIGIAFQIRRGDA